MATTNSQPDESNAVPEHTALKSEIVLAGLRQYVVAARVGLSEEQLSKILAGRKPLSPELASRIRDAIGQGAAA